MDFKSRTLDQILSELGSSFDPQVANVRKQQSLIPQTVQADIQQAESAQKSAYEDIVGGARRRGLGFSGIPLGEQAKYASSVFAPEVLRARARGSQQALSLEDAILGINERRATQAQSTFQIEQDRQFQADQARLAREAQSRAQARSEAAAARATLGGGEFGGGSLNGGDTAGDPNREAAYLEVQQRVAGSSDRDLISDYNATRNSANRGNARDKIKLDVYRAARPDLFRTDAAPFGGTSNGAFKSQTYSAPTGNRGVFGQTSRPQQVFIGGF
jgi:hypothetical protein